RFQSPNQLGNRRAVRDAVLGGVAMDAGTLVTLGIGAANRDPAQFPDPDRLDITRTPNRHLAFITGIHACAGMWLARMEGRAAIGGSSPVFRISARRRRRSVRIARASAWSARSPSPSAERSVRAAIALGLLEQRS